MCKDVLLFFSPHGLLLQISHFGKCFHAFKKKESETAQKMVHFILSQFYYDIWDLGHFCHWKVGNKWVGHISLDQKIFYRLLSWKVALFLHNLLYLLFFLLSIISHLFSIFSFIKKIIFLVSRAVVSFFFPFNIFCFRKGETYVCARFTILTWKANKACLLQSHKGWVNIFWWNNINT